uniref:G-protein coupled receptors family 1 profile domain-containing protein n=1 Tax=Ditylenchus dipsaci TaxID=166011 RepID=A0A915DKW7_9BILA
MSVVNGSSAALSAVLDLPYLPYLNLSWAISSLVCQFTTIAAMSFLLYCAYSKGSHLKTNSLSNSMLVYLIYHITFCVLCIPYHLPIFMKFIPATSRIVISVQLSNYIAIPVGLYYYHSPLPVFFLTVDRCLVLTFPFHYNKRAQKYFLFAAIYTIVSLGSINFTAFILTSQMNESQSFFIN